MGPLRTDHLETEDSKLSFLKHPDSIIYKLPFEMYPNIIVEYMSLN